MKKIGDACAHLTGDKSKYIRIGALFEKEGRMCLKIDTLPIEGSGWTGWVNIFEDKDVRQKKSSFPEFDGEDVPF